MLMSAYWRLGDGIKCCNSIAEVSSIEGRAGNSQRLTLAWLLPARMATNSTVSGRSAILFSLVGFSVK